MNPVKFLLVTAAVVCTVSGICADNTLLFWNFLKPDVLKGKNALVLRGKSTLGAEGLVIPVGTAKERGGAVAAKKENLPKFDGNFAVSVKFSISSKAQHIQQNLMLLDNKYVLKGKTPDRNSGFMLFLKRTKEADVYVPGASFGYGDESVSVYGTPQNIKSDKTCTLEMAYDCLGQVRFSVDGNYAGSCKVPAKPIAQAHFSLHIGDRAGSDHWPLGGTVQQVKVTKFKSATSLPAGSVLGSWDFTRSDVLNGKHPVKLRGKASLNSKGLEVNTTDPKQNDGAVLTGYFPELTPENAFEFTAKLVLDKKAVRTKHPAMICDSKYVFMPRTEAQNRFHKGFAFYLLWQANDTYRLGAAFGYGDKSIQISSGKVVLASGVEHTLSFHFSATGKVKFIADGKVVSTVNVPAGNIAASDVGMTFANRAGANYQPLGGVLKSVEMRSAAFTPTDFSADVTKRLVFERGEKSCSLFVDFRNYIDKEVNSVTVNAVNAGVSQPAKVIDKLQGKSSCAITFPVDTTLLPGKYTLELTAVDSNKKLMAARTCLLPTPEFCVPVRSRV